LCGAVIGRCQDHSGNQDVNSTVYRLLKYAIRPVSPTAELVGFVVLFTNDKD
jgi:hypothetical protein